jgi:hypothetical protein
MSDSEDDMFAVCANGLVDDGDESEEEVPIPAGDLDGNTEPWLEAFHCRADPEDVVNAWLSTMDGEGLAAAKADPHTARFDLKNAILASKSAGVARDAREGYKYMGGILRAMDTALGCKGKQGFAIEKVRGTKVPLEIIPGEGTPGTLGLWWSAFEAANTPAQ